MPTHWSLLKKDQKVTVDITELGFQRQGIIKYIGGVNGHYALNHKYYSPSLESGEGLEPWIGVELTKPLPFAQSHSGREYCGRYWFSCNPDSGYWCRSHQITILKNDPKIVGDLERRKKVSVDLGPILKKDLPNSSREIRSFYEPYNGPVLTDESDEDYLEQDLDYLRWREGQKHKAVKISSEVKKWKRLRSAGPSRKQSRNKHNGHNYFPSAYTDEYRNLTTRPSSSNARNLGHNSGQTERYLKKSTEQELNEALETVKRSKDYLRYISHKNDVTKAQLINSDSLKFGEYLDDLEQKQPMNEMQSQFSLRDSFDKLNISKRNPNSPRYVDTRLARSPRNVAFDDGNIKYDNLYRKSQNFVYSGPNSFKEANSIPVQHSDSFYLDYY